MKSFRIMTVTAVIFTAVIFTAAIFTTVAAAAVTINQNSDTATAAEATKKLGAFLGKWNTSATFASGEKATTELECRWSSQGNYPGMRATRQAWRP